MFRLGSAILLREVCKAPEAGHLYCYCLYILAANRHVGKRVLKYDNLQPLNLNHVSITEWLS